MIRKDIKNLYSIIEGVGSKSIPFSFTIYIEEIKMLLKPHYELFTQLEAKTTSELYKEYEAKRIEILRTYAKKDSNGDPIITNGQISFDNELEVVEKIDNLNFDYDTTIKEYNENEKLLEKYMSENVELNIKKVSIEDFPDELIEDIDSYLAIIED